MTRTHVLDPHLDVANRWLKEFAQKLDVPLTQYSRALHALRVGLHALRDRLPANEVLDLGAQLPIVIRGFYYEGWTLTPKRIRDRASMVASLRRQLAPDTRLDPLDVLRAVIELLVAHVSAGEIRDVLATLPKPIRELWQELAATRLNRPLASATRETQTRRTGYSR